MAKIVIKKKIELGFLGSDYEKDYLIFRSLPVNEYEAVLPQLEAVQDNGVASVKLIKQILTGCFIEGSWQGEAVTSDNIGDFDLPTLTKCFELFTGQVPDPKA